MDEDKVGVKWAVRTYPGYEGTVNVVTNNEITISWILDDYYHSTRTYPKTGMRHLIKLSPVTPPKPNHTRAWSLK